MVYVYILCNILISVLLHNIHFSILQYVNDYGGMALLAN